VPDKIIEEEKSEEKSKENETIKKINEEGKSLLE
jgi:hypothetical protein